MTQQQNPTPAEGDASNAEEATPMNRAERRAAAKGKKSAPAGGHGSMQSPIPHAGRPGGVAGQMRLPRTGHKGA